jgi:peptidoglycan LD-endopeptidase CwlK
MNKLEGVHPQLVRAVERIQFAMTELGHPMLVTDGVRTLEQQQALYAQGRTAPGPIVTKADGVRAKSNHQVKDDGFGHAVDMCFLKDGKASWAEDHPWRLYGEAAKALGLVWGGEFKSIRDLPHVELP